MIKKLLGISISLALSISLAAAPGVSSSQAHLSAAEIVDKNVTARGGLQAWRAVRTMSMMGKLGAGGNRRATLPVPTPDKEIRQSELSSRPVEEVQLPFVMQLQRPGKMRFELQFNGKTAIQVFDGANGWKLRPFLNRNVVEPYTRDEMNLASRRADLDGYLIDYAAKGTRIELAGVEKVEGHDAYKLKLTLKSGETMHLWIDAQTFLEAKIEGQPRQLDGRLHPVEIYYRDYRPVNGLQIPFLLETKVLPVAARNGSYDPPVPTEKIVVEKVVVNPNLEESLFSKPLVGVAAKLK